jgi:hypothetical protein
MKRETERGDCDRVQAFDRAASHSKQPPSPMLGCNYVWADLSAKLPCPWCGGGFVARSDGRTWLTLQSLEASGLQFFGVGSECLRTISPRSTLTAFPSRITTSTIPHRPLAPIALSRHSTRQNPTLFMAEKKRRAAAGTLRKPKVCLAFLGYVSDH